jgi:hypothetical protein
VKACDSQQYECFFPFSCMTHDFKRILGSSALRIFAASVHSLPLLLSSWVPVGNVDVVLILAQQLLWTISESVVLRCCRHVVPHFLYLHETFIFSQYELDDSISI